MEQSEKRYSNETDNEISPSTGEAGRALSGSRGQRSVIPGDQRRLTPGEPAGLTLVPSPIGNLQDITLRALETLKKADLILAEDTRNSSRLLNHYQINKPLTPYHQHNEHKIVGHLVDQLLQGKTMALLTDAGTPGVSDPAFLLVRECIRQGVRVECLPGATAFVPALVNSGLPMNRFCFEGFLPLKKGRQTLLKQLAEEERTLLFYESPMRLVKTLENFMTYFGEGRPCCVSRELTKLYEENRRGTLREVHDHYAEKGVKGEVVIVVGEEKLQATSFELQGKKSRDG